MLAVGYVITQSATCAGAIAVVDTATKLVLFCVNGRPSSLRAKFGVKGRTDCET